MNDITALMATMKAAAEKAKHAGEAPVMDFYMRIDALNEFQLAACPDNVLVLVEALEKAQADSSELKPANLINKFYERYPVASFKSESVRAAALGYFMAGAELQCFGEFVKYEELCSDE